MLRKSIAASLLLGAAPAPAQTTYTVDASAPVPSVETGYLKLGSNAAPDGTVLGVNNRYLTLDGKPWLPVMGEIHFVRLPQDEWDAELAKIKASGVDVIATYFFWNYHEETPGNFDWKGSRDIRRFVQLAQKHGLKVVLRLGPWSHGEVRYGGIPDWVVRELPLRSSDPSYMAYVDRYWGQIAEQVKGLLWKDGGPVIGIQLENEYNLTGQNQGAKHISDLKALALEHGFDVPFYTVTGWDNAVYPRTEVTPVFGGYPDEPWGLTDSRLPPKETYGFRFDSRVSGNLGAQTQAKSGGDADPDIPHTPFLGAEYAGGVPAMYRRRPVIRPDDIASMLPVQLGSGVNLYGYYMYHGGRNLIGRTTLNEAASIGGYNDLAIIEYDFQAPFGQYGEMAPVAGYIRPFHYFMQSYGSALAPMTVRKPAVVANGVEDLKTLRFSVRAAGDSGFLFLNNHVRQYAMAPHKGVRFSVKLPGGTLTFPFKPVEIADGAYFIWPIGLDLGGVRLAYATAQPVTRLETSEGPVHVFSAAGGIAPEFAFGQGVKISGRGISIAHANGRQIVSGIKPGTSALLTVTRAGSKPVRILVLTQAEARRTWVAEIAGARRLVLTPDVLTQSEDGLSFVSKDDAAFEFSVFPALSQSPRGSLAIRRAGANGVFSRYTASAQPRTITASLTPLRAAGTAPPVPIGGVADRAIEPWPEAFGRAAGAWTVTVPKDALEGVDDAFLQIDWAGDIARLFDGPTLIDDRYFNGLPWRIGLKRQSGQLGRPLTLSILPLRADAPVYIDEELKPAISKGGQIAEVRSIKVEPQYKLTVRFDR